MQSPCKLVRILFHSKISTYEDKFISTVKAAIKSGDIIRTQITPDNLKQVFDKWVVMIGREIDGVNADDYALLFFCYSLGLNHFTQFCSFRYTIILMT